MHDETINTDELPAVMKVCEAAAFLRLTVQRLAVMRLEGSGPQYIKAGRTVLYTRADVLAWVDQRKRRSTSDEMAKAA